MAYRTDANAAWQPGPDLGPSANRVAHSTPRTRLLPPRLGPGIVRRPRLARLLAAAEWPALALVTAPAGFGKTTLLRQWAEAAPFPAAWFTADRDDDLPAFVRALLAAIAQATPGAALPASRAGLAAGVRSPDALADALADDLVDLPDRLLLVVDDCHRFEDPAVDRFLARLLRHPAPGCTLAIGGRTGPSLPTRLLRGRGVLVELGPADLRFGDDEAIAALAPEGLDAATVAQALALAQGWPAGVRLLGAACRAAAHPAAGLAAGEAQAAGFLLAEVVRPLPADQRAALAYACVAERAPRALVDFLGAADGIGDAAAALDEVARATALVVPDEGDVPGFRRHPLLARAIALDAGESADRGRARRLHALASAWYGERGMVAAAVAQALAAGDEAGAARIVEDAARAALAGEDPASAAAWLALLPPALARSRPGLLIAAARLACLRGSLDDAEDGVERALALLARTGSADPAALGDANAAAGTVLRLRGDPAGAAGAARAALDLLPDDAAARSIRAALLPDLVVAETLAGQSAALAPVLASALAAAPGGSADDPAALLAAGIEHVLAGRLEEALALLRRLARRADRLPITGARGQLWLGRAYYQRNRLDEAAGCFGAVLAGGDRVDAETRREAAIGAVLVALARGRRREAASAHALLAASGGHASGDRVACSLAARVALLDGNLVAAARWLASTDADADPDPGVSLEAPGLTRVRVRLALGGRQRAQQALQEVRDLAGRPHVRFVRERAIEACALEALAQEAAANPAAAEQAVVRLLALAEPGRFVRAVLDAGPPIGPLLARNPDRFGAGPFLSALVAAAHRTDGRRGAALDRWPEPQRGAGGLSHREREVLDGLARRLTDKEIAQELRISPLTVKRHASNLYAKLGAAGRRDAVRKAHDLGLTIDDRGWRVSRSDQLR